MAGDADIATVAALIGDRTRACFLSQLIGGEGRLASELASAAGVSRATASFHLARLLAANLVSVRANGRHRSYHLADPEVAKAIESLQRIAPRQRLAPQPGLAVENGGVGHPIGFGHRQSWKPKADACR